MTEPGLRQVIEQFLWASRKHSTCWECTNTELRNTRFLMRFRMCNTVLAGRLVCEEEPPADYAGGWWEAERVWFTRLAECNVLNDTLFERLMWLRGRIEEHARRMVAQDGGDWTPRMRQARFLGYIQGHSECVGNPMDWPEVRSRLLP